jgi:hypothetical protein
MRKCPLNKFKPCIDDECPFHNKKLDACVLPRLVLSQIKANELQEGFSYEPKHQI